MNRLLLPILLLVLGTNFMNAQQHIHSERCGHSALMNAMEAKFPGYKETVNRTFEDVKSKGTSDSREILTIQTVVHIVWNDPMQDIPDAMIQEQIDVLNEDFGFTNPDNVNLRSEFASIAGDTEIRFELAGIERVQTTETFSVDLLTGEFPDGTLKSTANGGSDAWNTEGFLNIWVCALNVTLFGIPLGEGALLGYAFPPADIDQYPDLNNWPSGQIPAFAPEEDGVVIHYSAFGGRGRTMDVGGTMVNAEGRTTVHEVGHYLGLRHYWGDGDCTMDDGIDDTPAAAENSQQTGCVPTKNTCTDAGTDLPDMWENYMDYSDETCQVAFTIGQKDLMVGVLEGPRSGLLDPSVSVSESQALAQNVSVLPNPTSGLITVDIDFEDNDAYQLTVKDMMGRQLRNSIENNGSQNIDLDLSELSNGVYFIEITKGTNRFAKKVVLSK